MTVPDSSATLVDGTKLCVPLVCGDRVASNNEECQAHPTLTDRFSPHPKPSEVAHHSQIASPTEVYENGSPQLDVIAIELNGNYTSIHTHARYTRSHHLSPSSRLGFSARRREHIVSAALSLFFCFFCPLRAARLPSPSLSPVVGSIGDGFPPFRRRMTWICS